MYGLYGPNPIIEFIGTAVFYIVVGIALAGGAYIYYQDKKISKLEDQLGACNHKVEAAEAQESFLNRNLEIVRRNCNRRVKPIIKNGKFIKENLFDVDPR